MKAAVWTAYGPPSVLQIREVETPIPRHDQVRIRIRATTVTAGDVEMRTLKLPMFLGLPMRLYVGLTKPGRLTVLGQELAGEVDSVGKDVTRFKAGDRVCAFAGFRLGGYAEYICLPETSGDSLIGPMPSDASFEGAAALPFGALEALHFLRKAEIQPGDEVLINGAGGSIGTFGVQLAKHFGASVTAVDSTPKLDMLRSIGADHALDYQQENYWESGERYDVNFDVIGTSPYMPSMNALRPGGRFLMANPRLSYLMRGLVGQGSGKRLIAGSAARTAEDLAFVAERMEAGDLETVIDRTFPLEDIVGAHEYVETGAKQGNLVITVGGDKA